MTEIALSMKYPPAQENFSPLSFPNRGAKVNLVAPNKWTMTESASSLKKKIRDIMRLFSKNVDGGLNADIRMAQERKLKALQIKLDELSTAIVERHHMKKYRMVRFVERKKALRRVAQLERLYTAERKEDLPASPMKEARSDLNYICYFPKAHKYIALYPNTTDEGVLKKKLDIRQMIDENVRKGVLTDAYVLFNERAKKDEGEDTETSDEESVGETHGRRHHAGKTTHGGKKSNKEEEDSEEEEDEDGDSENDPEGEEEEEDEEHAEQDAENDGSDDDDEDDDNEEEAGDAGSGEEEEDEEDVEEADDSEDDDDEEDDNEDEDDEEDDNEDEEEVESEEEEESEDDTSKGRNKRAKNRRQ